MRKELRVSTFLFVVLCYFQLFGAEGSTNIEEKNFVDLVTNSNDNVTGACETDADCKYLGECNVEKGVGTCKCVRGITGEKCQDIQECVENKDMCGNVSCAFNFEKKKAYCRCAIRGQRFDVTTKTCVDQKPCQRNQRKQCKNEGYCAGKKDFYDKKEEIPGKEDIEYCECPLGTSGDFCERVEGCVKNPYYCGDGQNVECRFNPVIDRIYCQCMNPNQRFDLQLKKCVDRRECFNNDECLPFGVCTERCQSFEPCISHLDYEDKYSCHCLQGTSGHNCEIVDDCFNKVLDCGTDNATTCGYRYIEDITAYAYCKCKDNNLQFDTSDKTCKVCDCGALSSSCHYFKGEKMCTCKAGSFKSGDSCEDCKCGEGSTSCTFDGNKIQCLCKTGYKEFNNTCERCDCGPLSTDCEFDQNGKKMCSCSPGSIEGNYGVCTPMCDDKNKCSNGGLCLQNICMCLAGTGGTFCEEVYDCSDKLCGDKNDVYCKYDIQKQRAYCQCQMSNSKVFDPVDRECKSCDCGETYYGSKLGSCQIRLGQKICQCIEEYSFNPLSSKCEKCDCGKNGICSFIKPPGEKNPTKVCSCSAGYEEYNGKCTKCDCGIYGTCRFIKPPGEKNPIKVCSCFTGYDENNGKCIKCDCSPNGRCSYDFVGLSEIIKCVCDEGYQESFGTCKRCYCGPYTDGCYLRNTTKVCECSRGFKEEKGYCLDIDECLDTNICSDQGTECINTFGSFKCRCKPGYFAKTLSGADSPSLCQKEEPDYTPWKIGYGILSAGFIVIIIGLGIVIWKLKK